MSAMPVHPCPRTLFSDKAMKYGGRPLFEEAHTFVVALTADDGETFVDTEIRCPGWPPVPQ